MNEFNILIKNKIKKLQNANEQNGINKELSEYTYQMNSIPIYKNNLYKYIKHKDHTYSNEDIKNYIMSDDAPSSQEANNHINDNSKSQANNHINDNSKSQANNHINDNSKSQANQPSSQEASQQESPTSHFNFYSEYLGKNSVMNVLYNFKNISGDFLTGIYIGNCYVKKDDNISFHFGYSEILHGINNYLGKKYNKLWDYYFADKNCSGSKKLVNGHCDSGDIENINVVLSIKNDLYKISEKITFYTCDVYPKNIKYLYNSLLFAFEVKNFSFIRIGNPNEWNLEFVNFILFVMMMFKKVKIFKASWFDKPKYYLLLSEIVDDDQTQIIIMNYIKYLEYLARSDKCENICHLFTKKFITKHIQEYNNISKLKNDIQVQHEDKNILDKWVINFTK